VERAGVAFGGAACDEMAPGPRMPGLLNRLSRKRCEEC
jgi:hypothetical protein